MIAYNTKLKIFIIGGVILVFSPLLIWFLVNNPTILILLLLVVGAVIYGKLKQKGIV